MELSQTGQVIRNGQIYNVVVTGHALVIIFFFVIPVLIGGFRN